MTTRNIILYFIGIFFLCSCEDMFEPAKENFRTIEDFTHESTYAHGLLLYGYERLPYQTKSETDIATDDAVTNATGSGYFKMASGTWASDNDPMTRWNNCKDGIQYINLFFTIVDKVNWAPSAVSKQQMFIDRMKGEAFGLRALHYYHLLQAHGGYADDGVLYGVPLLTEPEFAGSDFNQPRALFSDCVKRVFEDCDSAIALLPVDYKDLRVGEEDQIPAKYRALGAERSGFNLVLGNNSRLLISGRIAAAIKAQMALLAVSPAFKDQSGVTAAEAANICAEALKLTGGIDGLDPTGHTWYKNKEELKPEASEMPEIVWRETRVKDDSSQEKSNFPPSLWGNGEINPSQNLVDAFPALNGYPIDDPRSKYNAKDPYADRDPRLANTVIYHGMTFKKKAIMTGEDFIDADNSTNDNIGDVIGKSTRTGYYMKKLLRDDVTFTGSTSTGQYHIYTRIRYTEIFLAYAEAANEAWGPKGDGGNGYSAYDVIKAIRQRAGIGTYSDSYGEKEYYHGDPYLDECADSKEKMAELIRNERRLELCFENKRFWDLRRWKMPLNESVKGVRITLNNETKELIYNPITVEERVFDNSYQCYGPIPRGEVLKWSKLKQNKGWE